ncbi:unnamed protein product [Macrosiphum euphorbiae]|uniref:Uncharacterized protein n=1 Tax=Macrosiphum euphorbiae TaxID=13131 RepID=A0AAV0Y7M8_9HEMI|nr:unnamed protein product [Macrosiphum euphorbiae]
MPSDWVQCICVVTFELEFGLAVEVTIIVTSCAHFPAGYLVIPIRVSVVFFFFHSWSTPMTTNYPGKSKLTSVTWRFPTPIPDVWESLNSMSRKKWNDEFTLFTFTKKILFG